MHKSAIDLPELVWETFRAYPCDANVMYPHAEKLRERERLGEPSSGRWITCTTSEPFAASTLEFVLSCTEGPLGSYPVFIFTTIPRKDQSSDYASRRIRAMIHLLARTVPPERVFSIFAPEQTTYMFARLWTEETGIQLASDPVYYAAKISYCTKRSFRPKRHTILPDAAYELRLAREEDAVACAELCFRFAKESVSISIIFVMMSSDIVCPLRNLSSLLLIGPWGRLAC